jgi:hypothetical protein
MPANTSKPKRERKPRAAKAAKASTVAPVEPVVTYRGEARDVATIDRAAASFGALSDRDHDYLALLGDAVAVFQRDHFKLAELRAQYGEKNPFGTTPSRKTTDAGYFGGRGQKSGYLTFDADTRTVAFATAEAKAYAIATRNKRS